MIKVIDDTYTHNLRWELRTLADRLDEAARAIREGSNVLDPWLLDESLKNTLEQIDIIQSEMFYIVKHYMDIDRVCFTRADNGKPVFEVVETDKEKILRIAETLTLESQIQLLDYAESLIKK